MDEVIKGTWLINSYKPLLGIRSDAPELSYFEATAIAGKAGMLLARLTADESEIVPADKVKAFARQSGISRGELPTCLRYIRKQGKIDFIEGPPEEVPDVEVYCFSTQDALATTSKIYDTLDISECEEASLVSLGETFLLPRSDHELLDALTSEGFSEDDAITTLKLQETLELVRVARGPAFVRPIFYNEHAFAESPEKIARALQGLSPAECQAVEDILNLVDETPGYPLDDLGKRHPRNILKMMEGVGLLDGMSVESPHAEAIFMTGPQLKGISIGMSPLSADVFHKAKLLLSSLRFGEIKSQTWRGKIESQQEMLHIVNKLLRDEWVGPCTAIGEDFTLLEIDGVIETRRVTRGWYGKYRMFEMKLRQREVGLLVRQILLYGRVLPVADVEFAHLLTQEPLVSWKPPEKRRSEILASPLNALL